MTPKPHTPTLRWSGSKRKRRPLLVFAWVAVAAFVLAFLFGIASWIYEGEDGIAGVDRGCERNAWGCNLAIEMLGTLAAVALAFVWFASWRIKRVIRPHLADASSKPWKLVPTASPIQQVVGRTGLCEIIERDLAETSRPSRPQAIVAGVGDGKTAALVRLTQYLFERGAVPVPIALREAERTLDFQRLAKERFLERVGPSLLSDVEGDKVWRELCADRHIVIVADGLEEALPNISDQERAKRIEFAIGRVNDAGLPLVIATRPHAALEEIDIAIIRLEPLPAASVVEYIAEVNPEDSTDHVEQLTRNAGLMERPLYLRLARELHRHGKLSTIPRGGRLRARFELLSAWRTLLAERRTFGNVRIRKEDRRAALELAEQLACVALVGNVLEVRFDAVAESPFVPIDHEQLSEAQVFTGHAERLDLVESIPGGVRFRHGITEAYLGARYLHELLGADGGEAAAGNGTGAAYLDEALKDPGRELTMALVLCCLFDGDSARPKQLRERLSRAAENFDDRRAFELLAAAYEIDSLVEGSGDDQLNSRTVAVWRRSGVAAEDIDLIEAKLRVILPITEAGAQGHSDACKALWDICLDEDVYVMRFQAAQQLATVGESALTAMPDEFGVALSQAGALLAYRDRDPPRAEGRDVRRLSLLGWMMPLLAATADASAAKPMRDAIEEWVRLAREGTAEHPGLHLGVEATLAQGFKWEANRIPGDGDGEKRAFLIVQALALLEASGWWQTQVALLQALTLWALDENQPHRSEIRTRVRSYLRRRHHPFVRQVASGCITALRIEANPAVPTRDRGPSRYLWIDEMGVAAKIGPRTLPPDYVTGLWIPPAAGWHTLSPRLRQLVAEMLLFLNLVEGYSEGGADDDGRSRRAGDREARRASTYMASTGLPTCLTRPSERTRLCIDRDSADEDGHPRSADCGCGFGLCPYVPRGARPFRGEVPETFCREQQTPARPRITPTAVVLRRAPLTRAGVGSRRGGAASVLEAHGDSRPDLMEARAAARLPATSLGTRSPNRRPRQTRQRFTACIS